MLGYNYFYQQIAALAAIRAWLALSADTNALAIVDTGRNRHLDLLCWDCV